MVIAGPLDHAHAVTKLPVRDLERARAWYRDHLGLEAAEAREGGLRYVCGTTEFHLFLSSGSASGAATQMGLEVEDLAAAMAALRRRGVVFERFAMPIGVAVREDGVIEVPGNYSSKGTGELGVFFRDADGNLIGLAQATGERA